MATVNFNTNPLPDDFKTASEFREGDLCVDAQGLALLVIDRREVFLNRDEVHLRFISRKSGNIAPRQLRARKLRADEGVTLSNAAE